MTEATKPTRRTALTSAAAATVAGLALGTGSTAEARPRHGRGTTTFVIMPGASGSPGSLDGIALRGHRSVGVTAPGHGPADAQFALDYQCPQQPESLATRPSPMKGVGLDAFAEAAIETVRTVARFGPVILYGGSMGGVTLNRVGNAVPHLIDHLVYDAAFCCVELPSADDYFTTPEGSTSLAANLAPFIVGDPAMLGAVRANYRSADTAALAGLRETMMAGASDAEFYQLLACLHPDESLTVSSEDARVRAATWGRIPRTYIRHTRDRMIPIELQDRMIAEADRLTPRNRFDVRTIDAPHALNAAQFAQVIDILDGLATSRSPIR